MSRWLHRAARDELTDAADYYAEHASARVADSFLNEFERTLTLIESNQQIGTIDESGLRLYPFHRFPYSIVYRESPTGPRIFAVASQHRQPNYWRRRI